MTLLAVVLGLLIGLVVGALGGGGSVLTVPALVFALGLTAQAATTASLVIVGITSGVASVAHARSGHTRWREGGLLAAAGIPASLSGTWLNQLVEEDVLLLAFAALMLVAAAGMLLRPAAAGPAPDGIVPDGIAPDGIAPDGGDVPAGAGGGGRHWLRLSLAGSGIGFLTGFLGVGGGFVIVPALVLALRFPIAVAVGTSLMVIALNAVVALLARAGTGGFEWDVIVPFTTAAVLASLLGKRVADRLPSHRLTQGFAVLLVLIAAYVGVRAVLGLI